MATDPKTSEINELKKKLEENPDSLVFAALADAYRKKGQLDEAFKVCKTGLEKNPSYTSARVVLGRIYREQEKVEDAASEFKKVLEFDPDNLMAHSMLGSILMEKKDYQAAIEEYQKILSLNPDDEETQSNLKLAIEKAAGETKQTSRLPKKESSPAERKSPRKESTATLTLAELYFKQGHYDRAIEVYQELLANDPQNLMLRQKMSEVVNRQQKDAAVDTASSKLKKNEFTQPPDQKEDVIVDEGKSDKRTVKEKKSDDFKFTNEDILLVMRRGGKDDVVVEEKTPLPTEKKSQPPVEAKPAPVEKAAIPPSLISPEQNSILKEALGELISVNGMLGCFFINTDGNIIVSLGEANKSPDLVKQALAIFQSTDRSAAQMNQGKLQQVLVTAQTGHILLVSFAKLILVALASERVNLGLLRLALDSALKKLGKIS
jgi:tetratricopeptide (TPR) repeat protein